MKKQFDIARTSTVGPKPTSPQQGSCPLPLSLFNKYGVSVYGVSLGFFPHSFPDCRPSSLSPATLPYMTKFTIPSHHCISGTNSMSRINICHMEPESERRHSIIPAEKESWTISFQNNWGIQNSASDLPGPGFQQCSIPPMSLYSEEFGESKLSPS